MTAEALPEGWTRATLGEVTTPKVEQSGPRADSDEFVYVDIGSIGSAKSISARQVVPTTKAPSRARQRLEAKDVLVSMTRPNLNAVALVPTEFDGAIGSSGFHVLRSQMVDARYLFAVVRSPAFVRAMTELVQGALYPAVRPYNVRDFEFALPPAAEQKRIVAKVEELTVRNRRAKEALDAVPPLLDQLRQSILAAAFRGDLTADWRAKNPDIEPADKLLSRIRVDRRRHWENSQLLKMRVRGKVPADTSWKGRYREPEQVDVTGLPRLPAGWCWASIDDVSELQLGQQRAPVHAAAERTHPYIRAANITWEGLDLSDVKRMGFPDPERYRLQNGDVLLNEASGSATEVGKPAIWRGEISDCCYQKTLLRVRPISDGASCDWLHLSFLADALLGRFARMAPGVGILHLTADRMLSWPVPLAPLPEQRHLVGLTRQAFRRLKTLDRLSSALAANIGILTHSILAKAFRGELVPQDPNDEPASILLERIHVARNSATMRATRHAGRIRHRTDPPKKTT